MTDPLPDRLAEPFPVAGLIQDLESYRLPPDWHPGAPWLLQSLWFCFGAPLLATRWLPGSPWRVQLLRLFGARVGGGTRIKPGLRVKFPWRLVVGRHCWLGEDVWIDNLAPVRLADRVCLSQGAYLCTGNHDHSRSTFDLWPAPIEIGSQAWIAAQARLAPGTRVGAGAVIGFAAVVSGEVPSGAILRGNPAAITGWRQRPLS